MLGKHDLEFYSLGFFKILNILCTILRSKMHDEESDYEVPLKAELSSRLQRSAAVDSAGGTLPPAAGASSVL